MNAPDITVDETLFNAVWALQVQTAKELCTTALDYPLSDDGMDYLRSALANAERLTSIRLDGTGPWATGFFKAWLTEEPGEWLACDGDVRFWMHTILRSLDRLEEADAWQTWIELGQDMPDPMPDIEALDRILNLMSHREWNADTLDAIAEIVKATGRTIEPPEAQPIGKPPSTTAGPTSTRQGI